MQVSSHIHLHPNSENPQRLRLQMRELNVQEYFSFKACGSMETALEQAKARRDKLLKIKKLRGELGFKKVFAENGLIKGLRMHADNKRNVIIMSLYASANEERQEFIKEMTVNEDNLDDTFFGMLSLLLDVKGISLDPEDKVLIKKIRMNYVRKYHNSVKKLSPDREVNKESRRKYYSLIDHNGLISGLRITDKKSRGAISFLLRVREEGEKVKEFSRKIQSKSFNATYYELLEQICDAHNIDLSENQIEEIEKARKKYRRQFGQMRKLLGQG